MRTRVSAQLIKVCETQTCDSVCCDQSDGREAPAARHDLGRAIQSKRETGEQEQAKQSSKGDRECRSNQMTSTSTTRVAQSRQRSESGTPKLTTVFPPPLSVTNAGRASVKVTAANAVALPVRLNDTVE